MSLRLSDTASSIDAFSARKPIGTPLKGPGALKASSLKSLIGLAVVAALHQGCEINARGDCHKNPTIRCPGVEGGEGGEGGSGAEGGMGGTDHQGGNAGSTGMDMGGSGGANVGPKCPSAPVQGASPDLYVTGAYFLNKLDGTTLNGDTAAPEKLANLPENFDLVVWPSASPVAQVAGADTDCWIVAAGCDLDDSSCQVTVPTTYCSKNATWSPDCTFSGGPSNQALVVSRRNQ